MLGEFIRRPALIIIFLTVFFYELPIRDVCAQQNQLPNVFGTLGGIINQAQANQRRQAASNAWSAVDPNITSCLSGNLGINIQQLINNGIGPDDPKISGRIQQCRQMIAAAQARQQQEAEHQKQLAIDQANAERDRQRKELEAQTAYLKAKSQAEKAAADAKAKSDEQEKQRRDELVGLRNDFILAGLTGSDPRDVTVMIVAHDTPRVIRGLSGEPSFQHPAAACFPFGPLSVDPSSEEGRFVRNVAEKIAQKGGAQIMTSTCTPGDFGRFDLFVFTAGQLSNANLEMLRPLSTAIKDGSYTKLATYSETEFEAAMQAQKAAIEADDERRNREKIIAKEAFQKRDETIISAVYLEKPSGSTCLLTPQKDSLHYLLQRTDSPFADLVTKDTILRDQSTMDLIFLSIKKRECTAVIAPTGKIKEIIAALSRDNIMLDYHKSTIAADQVDHWKDLADTDQSGSSKSWWRSLIGR